VRRGFASSQSLPLRLLAAAPCACVCLSPSGTFFTLICISNCWIFGLTCLPIFLSLFDTHNTPVFCKPSRLGYWITPSERSPLDQITIHCKTKQPEPKHKYLLPNQPKRKSYSETKTLQYACELSLSLNFAGPLQASHWWPSSGSWTVGCFFGGCYAIVLHREISWRSSNQSISRPCMY
jgi:hypothetical protein